MLTDNTGPRLENSFWRILRSDKIMQRMTGRRLARQVKSITDGGYIRTTPTGSPRASRNLETYQSITAGAQGASTASSHLSPAPASFRDLPLPDRSEDDSTPTPQSVGPFARRPVAEVKSVQERKSNLQLGRLPPILKKPGPGSRIGSAQGSLMPSPTNIDTSPVVGSMRGIIQDPFTGTTADVAMSRQFSAEGQATSAPKRYTATRFNEEVKVSIPKAPESLSKSNGEKSPRARYGSYSKSNKRNPVVKASTGSSKRRPVMMRHRSSGTSQDGSLGESSPAARGRKVSDSSDIGGSGDSAVPVALTKEKGRSRASSPHPVGRSSREARHRGGGDGVKADLSDEDEDEDAATSESPQDELRLKTKKGGRVPAQHRSFTNLPSAAWRSSAAAPAAASYQALGLLSPGQEALPTGRSRTAFKEDIVPLKAPGPSDTDKSSTEPPSALPQTRSQLALLLERTLAPPADKKKGKEPRRK